MSSSSVIKNPVSVQKKLFMLKDNDFTDTFSEAGSGWGNTYHRAFPILRLDHIFASPAFYTARSKVVTSHHSNDSFAPSLSRTNNARSMVEVSTLRSGGDRAFTSQSVRRLSHRILKGNAVRTQNTHTRAVSSKTYTDYTRAGHSDLKCNTAPLPVRAYHIQLPGVIIKNARRGSLRPVGTTTALLPLRTESPHVQACRTRPNTMGPLPQLCNVSDVRSTPAIHRKIIHSTLT